MWLTILDYENGEIIIEEISHLKPGTEIEGYVHEKLGHSSECHMVGDELNLKVNQE